MDYREILSVASSNILTLNGRSLDIITVQEPPSIEYAKQLAKVISKLSPFLGNMIEFSTVDLLNTYDWEDLGVWKRQDPGFPDATFESATILPNPGIEIKTWFPLATEITARFKDSVLRFNDDQINVAMIAWLPEHVIWGHPVIIDTWVGSAVSVAAARDAHYHNPPSYLVFEPEDTHDRTVNLQQTNTNGYTFQGSSKANKQAELQEAEAVVNSWGDGGRTYSTDPEYQAKLNSLLGQFKYRLDTNFAKMDRIEHPSLEAFKARVLATQYKGHTIQEWSNLLSSADDAILEAALTPLLP